MSNVPDQIREAIRTSDKTRYRLAKETGIDQSHLGRFVAGTKGLRLDAIGRLAEALGLEIIIRKKTKQKEK